MPLSGTGWTLGHIVVPNRADLGADVVFAARLAVMLGQLWTGFPLNSVGRLLLAQEDEVVELGGVVAISVGWQSSEDPVSKGLSLPHLA